MNSTPPRDTPHVPDWHRWAPIALALVVLVAVIALSRSGGADNGAVEATSTTAIVADTVVAAPTTTVPKVPIARTLVRGLAGEDVRMVQTRLAEMGFDPGPIDGVMGTMTAQAIWAYEKLVLGVPRTEATGSVTPEMWDRMQEPSGIRPRRPTGGVTDHTEIYLPEQVLAVFQADVPVLITHISSGELDEFGEPALYCETVTYDTDSSGNLLEEPITRDICAYSKTPGGVFTYRRMIEGTRNGPLGDMWNPVYFNYGIAVHGALNVPLEPASHGCVRLPMHISEYFQGLIDLGDKVLVWNGEQEPEDVSDLDSLPSFDGSVAPPSTTTSSTLPGQIGAPIEHIITRGDNPSRIAEMYGITLALLSEANAENADYRTFPIGGVLIIPAGAFMPSTTTTAPTTTSTTVLTATTTSTTEPTSTTTPSVTSTTEP